MAMWKAWRANHGMLEERCPFYSEGTWGRSGPSHPHSQCVNEVTGEVFGQRCCSTHKNMLIFRATRAELGDPIALRATEAIE